MAKVGELIGQIALQCGDEDFKDFNKNMYYTALYKGNREVARKYHIIQKTYEFVSGSAEGDINISLSDMKEPIAVYINGIQLRKKDHSIDVKDYLCYYMFKLQDGTVLFNYKLRRVFFAETETEIDEYGEYIDPAVIEEAQERTAEDTVLIIYEAIPEIEVELGEYTIPSNYEEEQIEYAVIYLAKIGIAKFRDEKMEKWTRLYRMYRKDSDFNKQVVETTEFTRIQPFRYP